MKNYKIVVNHRDEIECETLEEMWENANKIKNLFHFVELLRLDDVKANTTYWKRVETFCDGNVHKWKF